MRKTLFAGLTVLDPDEPITLDGSAALGRDRDTIDRFLLLGAKTHRHNGLPGLTNPVTPLGSAVVLGSGGTIEGGASFSFGYTLEDDALGETILSPITNVTTPAQIAPPSQAPTAVADYTTGDLLTDTYYYAKSWVDAGGGETPVGPTVTIQRAPGYPDGRIILSGLDDGMGAAGAAGWRLYRAIGGGDLHLLATGSGDGYTDDGSGSVDCDQPPLANGVNSTNGTNRIRITLPADVDDASFINLYASRSGTFAGDVFLEQFPAGSAGEQVTYQSIDLFNQQPPDRNLSVGGAHLIDPDTELEDWHWKRPVATFAALPATDNEDGDVRVVVDELAAYIWDGDWNLWEGSGGGGGSAVALTVEDSNESYDNVEVLHFTNAEIADMGGGVVNVTVPTGSGGGGGASGIAVYDGTTSTLYEGVYQLDIWGFDISYAIDEFTPGELALFPSGGGGGPSARSTANYTTATPLADGTTEDSSIDLSVFAAANVASFIYVDADFDCRVRLYASFADQAADSSRPFGTDPAANSGLILDVEVGTDPVRLNPIVEGATDAGDSTFYLSIENQSGGTETITVTFTYVPIAA